MNNETALKHNRALSELVLLIGCFNNAMIAFSFYPKYSFLQ